MSTTTSIKSTTPSKRNNNYSILVWIPLIFPIVFLIPLLDNPFPIILRWINMLLQKTISNSSSTKQQTNNEEDDNMSFPPPVGSQLLAYVTVAIFGYIATEKLVLHISEYTLRKGICGKDLGKRGTALAEKPIPEALGIASGTIFLICLIFCLVGYTASHPMKLLDVNSAILSICFMLFLGFTDDVLDWPWRYKLVLPSIASLPLLCCYNGSTNIVVPIPFRTWFVTTMLNNENESVYEMTWFGNLLNYIIDVDIKYHGTLINLGIFYLLYMGMLAVFCTNAINIYAGINGLEVGQSYVVGCAVLVHNLIEISLEQEKMQQQQQQQSSSSLELYNMLQENHLFSVMLMTSFIGVTIGLLKHNWYPANVFVGDTYCYFAGMTFAVVGILGHFSKTLLLFFIPQILNFLYSIPQLFKLVPCPRHRLPSTQHRKEEEESSSLNTTTKPNLMIPSTFEIKSTDYIWIKRILLMDVSSTYLPNMTIINLTLRIVGPVTEETLCTILLAIQMISCAFGLFLRYYVATFFF